MADKKMTQLDPLSTGLDQDDIFHVVDGPDEANPQNKKITVANMLNPLTYTTVAGDVSTGKSFIKATTQVNTNFTSSTADVAGLDITASHVQLSTASNTVVNLYGSKVTVNVAGGNANATGTVAGQQIVLNMTSQANTTSVNTAFTGGSARAYGLQVVVDDTGSNREVKPDAFLCLNDGIAYAADDSEELYGVSYLMELGSGSDYVVATANSEAWANGHAMVVTGNTGTDNDRTADTKIRIKVNGTEYFLLATSNAHYQS